MKLCRILLLAIGLLPLMIAAGYAQPGVDCGDETKSPIDIVNVRFTKGAPESTVVIPVRFKNDSVITGFEVLIQYDTLTLQPVAFPQDPSFFKTVVLSSRLLKTIQVEDPPGTGQFRTDTVTAPQAVRLENTRNVIRCLMLPRANPNQDPGNPNDDFIIDSVLRGDDALFGILFKVTGPRTAIGDTARFSLFERQLLNPDLSLDRCELSNLSEDFTLGGTTFTNTVYPTTPVFTNFVVDTVKPVSVTLAANPTTITSGQSSILSWTHVNADSVRIETLTGSVRVGGGTAASGTVVVNPTVTTSYIARAYDNGTEQATASANVTVTTGGGGNNSPILTVPSTRVVEQGEALTFQVSATDPNAGDQITITATSMPSGATFGNASFQVVGPSGVAGTFNWANASPAGNYNITFTARDNSNNTDVEVVTIVVQAPQFDRLFSTSVEGKKPSGGLPGKQGVIFPVNLTSSKPAVYGVQYDLSYPANIIALDSIILSPRIPEYVLYDNIGETPGQIRVTAYGLQNETVISVDSTTALMYIVLGIDSTAVPWTDARMRLTNGREAVSADPLQPTLPLVTDSGVIQIDKRGDVNLDRFIDVGDAVGVVSYIIGTFGLPTRNFETADVLTDSFVDVFDLVSIVNLIYDPNFVPSPAPVVPGQDAVVTLAYDDLSAGSQDTLVIRSEIPEAVAGVQLELRYDPNSLDLLSALKTADNSNFSLQYRDDGNGLMRVLVYSLGTNTQMPAGTVDLVKMPMRALANVTAGNKSQLRLSKALMSNPDAAALSVKGVDPLLPGSFSLGQNYPNPFNPTTTIEFTIGSAAANVRLEIFNVLGQQVATLVDGPMQPGEYRMQWNATTETGQRVASGVYLYRLQVDAEAQTRKMLFLK